MDEKTLKDFTKKRSELIASLMSSMDGQVKDNQKKLLEKVLEKFVDKLEKDENGNVKNNDRNRNLLIQFDDIFKEYQKKEARDTVGLLLQSVGSIINFNQKYFSALDGQARTLPIIPKVKDFMKVWLGIKGDVVEPNGYLDKLVSNDPAKIALKNQAMKIVIGQEGFEDAKKQIKTLIDGNQNTMGALEKHHRNFAFDLYSQIDRATSDVIRNDLGFVFAIYEGGLIETSRIFCEEHDGNIYHISEIKDFNPTEAKPPNYNPITDLGGYGCRHHLNWISTAMAKAMGKDVDKFLKSSNDEKIIKDINKNTKLEEKQNKFNLAKNIKELKDLSKEIFNAKKIEINENEDLSLMKFRLNKLNELFNEFNIKNKNGFEKISFISSKNREGVVKSDAEGNTISVSFGNKKQNFEDFEKTDDYMKNLKLDRPNIDEKNIEFYVQTHEFAHLLDFKDLRKPLSIKSDFIKELEVINNEYKNEFSKYFDENKKMGDFKFLKPFERRIYKENLKKMSEIHLGTYANTNINEFMAEAFSEYVLNSNPSKYAKKVGELINKYFKKK